MPENIAWDGVCTALPLFILWRSGCKEYIGCHFAPPYRGQANIFSVLQRGRAKLSHPSLRPRLYLSPGEKGYVGGATVGEVTGTEEFMVEDERQVRSIKSCLPRFAGLISG